MSNFDKQFSWQAGYIDEVVRLIAPYIITLSRPEVDKNENGDLEIVFPRNGTVGVRLRKEGAAKFAGQVTFRSRSMYGGKTEITKIIEGYGDYFFYGHVSPTGVIWHWYLLNLNEVRAAFTRRSSMLRRPQIPNGDDTYFIPFDVQQDFPKAIIAHYDDRKAAA